MRKYNLVNRYFRAAVQPFFFLDSMLCLVGEILTIHHLNKSSELDHSFFNFLAFLFIYFLEQGKSCQKLSNSSQKSFNCIFLLCMPLVQEFTLLCAFQNSNNNHHTDEQTKHKNHTLIQVI